MRSPFNFIVTPCKKRRYDNIKEMAGKDIITSVSKEDHLASNRFAIVKETPLGYKGPIQKGDTLLVHHNVFKFYYDMKGREKSGRSFFKDDLFFVDYSQFFLYKQKETWHAYDKYCFVKPIAAKESWITKNGEEPLTGTMKYINEDLKKLGVKEGDEVSFQPNSEYPFTIDGEKLYRMYTENITLIL
jgi:co-chaperonin GroES (HSP10)